MRDCSEQQCSALLPTVKDTGLSSTHLCWEPLLVFHSKNSTHKPQSLFIYKTNISQVYVPFYTTKEYYWGFPLCCVYQKMSSNVTMTSCLLTVVYLRLQTLFFYCKWAFPIQMSICGLCLVSQNPASCVGGLCVLQRLLNTQVQDFDFQVHSVSIWYKVKMSS